MTYFYFGVGAAPGKFVKLRST